MPRGTYEVEVVDNTAEFEEELEKICERILESIGTTAEGYAKKLCPVDTGRLRNSITHALAGQPAAITSYSPNKRRRRVVAKVKKRKRRRVKKKAADALKEVKYYYVGTAPSDFNRTVYVGTNVPYGRYVECGNSRPKYKAQPFLKPAIINNRDKYERLAKKILKDGLEEFRESHKTQK